MLKRRLKEPFGKAGLIVAVFALVFAMLGGAYAATGGNGGAKATASGKKSSKGKQGKQGKTGKTGPAGPAGPTGPVGAPGAKGDAGAAGSNGTNGTNGTPGAKGEKGPKGDPGEFPKVLPKGQTETGTWGAAVPSGFLALAPISFSIPLSTPGTAFFLTPTEIEEEEGPGFNAGCTGSVKEPTAPSGILCAYASELENAGSVFISFAEALGYQPIGTLIRLESGNEAQPMLGNGSWAVTAP